VSKVDRYDPCPCGSGKKYKFCCQPKDAAAHKTVPVADINGDPKFICEIRPDVDEKVDKVLERMEMGQRDGIEAALMALLNKHPRCHTPQFGMGVYKAMVLGDDAGSIPFFERAIELFPYFAEGHYNLAASALKIGDVKKSALSFRKAIRYCDNDPVIMPKSQEQLAFLENITRKETCFKSLDDLIENQTLFDDAFEALTKKEYKKAVEGFKKVLEGNPDHVQSYGNLGLAYSKLGQKANALECLDKALALDPGYEPAQINRLSVLRMTEGKPDKTQIGETSYYLEKVKEEEPDAAPRSWWDRIKKLGL
jgi:protein O-GlcNAc transferase